MTRERHAWMEGRGEMVRLDSKSQKTEMQNSSITIKISESYNNNTNIVNHWFPTNGW